ncbi:MAG: polysaccharide deacetylase family protein [Candidatus Tantalella remota]|nr:polysaccharide deacetylase family protein [Candidatus Tantalella remota]
MRIIKLAATLVFTAVILAATFYVAYMKPRHVVPILMYHAVSDVEGSSLNVTPKNFARQMDFLHDAGYSVISLNELVDKIKKGDKAAPKTVVITFDDGYEDNYLHAFPSLEKYDMPATIFLITGYVDTRKNYLKWEQVRLMMKNGMDFGGHTRDDVYLPGVRDEHSLWNQIAGSREDIESNIDGEALYFCYPTGGFTEQVKDIVKKAGYKGACTTNRGYDRSNTDVYELNRVKITNSDTTKPFHFRAKLSGYYNLFRSLKSGS